MKSVKLFFLFFVASFALFEISATEAAAKKSVSEGSQVVLKRYGHKTGDKRPKSPSRQQIICTYDGDAISIDFTLSEGFCEVYLTELQTGITMSYYVDSADLAAEIHVGSIAESLIEIKTEQGNSYSGTFLAEEIFNI